MSTLVKRELLLLKCVLIGHQSKNKISSIHNPYSINSPRNYISNTLKKKKKNAILLDKISLTENCTQLIFKLALLAAYGLQKC